VSDNRAPRWDGDEKYKGIAPGSAFASNVERLGELMKEDGWVAEDPEMHLLPHIQSSTEKIRSLELIRAEQIPHGIFEVKFRWEPTEATAGDLRSEIYSIIGSFAESATEVEQKVVGDEIHFEVVTGMPSEETRFATHGHLIRLRVTGEAAGDAAQNHRDFMTPIDEGATSSSSSPEADAAERAAPS
jgi:hypothetical protein